MPSAILTRSVCSCAFNFCKSSFSTIQSPLDCQKKGIISLKPHKSNKNEVCSGSRTSVLFYLVFSVECPLIRTNKCFYHFGIKLTASTAFQFLKCSVNGAAITVTAFGNDRVKRIHNRNDSCFNGYFFPF